MYKGKLIVFEGLDCSFKETNSKSFANYLLSTGKLVECVSFPRYDKKESIFIKNYLNGEYGEQKDLNSTTISLCYMMDMMDYMKRDGLYKLKNGVTLILDRYWYSNIYYRLGYVLKDNCKVNDRSSLILYNEIKQQVALCASMLELPKADIIFKMVSDIDIMFTVIKEKHKRCTGDLHENDFKFLKNVAICYRHLDLSKYTNNTMGAFTISTTEIGENGIAGIKSKDDIMHNIICRYEAWENNIYGK